MAAKRHDEAALQEDRTWLVLHKGRFVQLLDGCIQESTIEGLRRRAEQMRDILLGQSPDDTGVLDSAACPLALRQDILLSELDQVLSARTMGRARHYLGRLKAGAEQPRTAPGSDINVLRWKEYDDVLTDSLWIIPRRDSSGAHLSSYWGNFVPQIPRQLLLRFTRRGEWVLDPFSGSGTTLIECRRLGRNGIGVELNVEVAGQACQLVASEPNRFGVVSDTIVGDSTSLDFAALLRERGVSRVQLLIMHPPYHDIIRFSADPRDLSNAASVEQFLAMLGQVVERTFPLLDDGRHLAVVIGDKYLRGEWVPLGFYVMEEVRRQGYRLKSIVVKNFQETRGKRGQQELWRYRALAGGFYVFRHEYILLFQKRAARKL